MKPSVSEIRVSEICVSKIRVSEIVLANFVLAKFVLAKFVLAKFVLVKFVLVKFVLIKHIAMSKIFFITFSVMIIFNENIIPHISADITVATFHEELFGSGHFKISDLVINLLNL